MAAFPPTKGHIDLEYAGTGWPGSLQPDQFIASAPHKVPKEIVNSESLVAGVSLAAVSNWRSKEVFSADVATVHRLYVQFCPLRCARTIFFSFEPFHKAK